MALARFMDQVGDWNPQLLRELRGRLTRRNLIITTVISIGFQWLFYQVFSWNTFGTLQAILPSVLVIFGSYLLSYDLSKEYQKKTIEFIRLTPQSSQEILIGKLLGVPILIYLAILLAIPLHLIGANLSLFIILGYYILWLIKAWIFYTFGLIYSLSILKQNQLNYPPSVIAGSVALMVFILNQINFQSFADRWYGLNLSQSNMLMGGWLMVMGIIIGCFLWQILNRQFQNCQATLITKKQSYYLTLFINLLILGFVIHSSWMGEFTFFWLFVIVPMSSLIFTVLLFPQRQYLLDWARYGHVTRNKRFWQDLILGENSPPMVAILINALIATAIWFSFLLFTSPNSLDTPHRLSILQLLLAPIITISMILIYVMVAQILMMTRHKNAPLLSMISVIGLITLPPIIGLILKVNHWEIPLLWMFTPLPIVAFYKSSLVASIAGLSLQLAILGILTAKLKQQIYLAGASETQTLFNGH